MKNNDKPNKLEKMLEVKYNKKEKIPIFIVYKEDKQIKTDIFPETNDFELFGFLACFLEGYELGLIDSIEQKPEDDDFDK
jgi:hypothetical protein